MRTRRGASGLSGVLLVDKPSGSTSHDIINLVRKATGERRVGHAGTLDPMATGLLVVLVGPATRLSPYLTAEDKAYAATIAFGSATDTDDAEGEIIRTAPVLEHVLDARYAEEVLGGFLGESMQRPPAYSAIKVGGQVAHRAARAGGELAVPDRAITIFEARLLGIDTRAPAWDVAFRVSKGTYVRSLARDIGERVGSAAHLTALRRTAAGVLSVDDAAPVSAIANAEAPDDVARLFADPVAAVGMPAVEANEGTAVRVAAGQALAAGEHCSDDCPADKPIAIVREGVLLAIYTRSGDILKPQTVIPGGVRGGDQWDQE